MVATSSQPATPRLTTRTFSAPEKPPSSTTFSMTCRISAAAKIPGKWESSKSAAAAGRVTRALAKLFGEVHAVDVGGEMVVRAREAVAEFPNAFIHQNNGTDSSVV